MNKEEYEKELKKIKVIINKEEPKTKKYIRFKKTFVYEMLNFDKISKNILKDLKIIYKKYEGGSAVINEYVNLYVEYRKVNKISQKPVLLIKWVDRIFVITEQNVYIFPNTIDEERWVLELKKEQNKYDIVVKRYDYNDDGTFLLSDDEDITKKKFIDYRRSLYDTREVIRILKSMHEGKYYNQMFNKIVTE